MGSEKPTVEDGVILFIRHFLEGPIKYKVVDDTTVPGSTLAMRRLHLLKEGVPLRKLDKAVFFLGDLVKLATATMWFIDSSGLLFQYKKTTSAKLLFKKITHVHPIPSGGAVIEIEGIPSRFKCLFAPKHDEKFAGVLVHGRSYILYGLYKEQFDNTRRNI